MIAATTAIVLAGLGVTRNYLLALIRHRAGELRLMELLKLELAPWLMWLLLFPGLVAICERLPIRSQRDLRRIGAHLLLFPLFHAALAEGTSLLVLWLSDPPVPRFDPLRALFWVDPTFTAVLYTSIVAILHLVRHSELLRDRDLAAEVAAHVQARLRERLALLRLESLQRQLQPHFLFNTLNTISSLIPRDPALARQLISRLGTLLRRALAEEPRALVPLRDELDFLRAYVAIQQARFRDALQVDFLVPPEVEHLGVPPMLLQPLVENSLVHGRAEDGTCHVVVRAWCADGHLELRVEDDGPGLPRGRAGALRPRAGTGVGLRNTRERLETLFGERASLRLDGNERGGGSVGISLPAVPVASERRVGRDDSSRAGA